MSKPFAVFVVACRGDKIAATSRPLKLYSDALINDLKAMKGIDIDKELELYERYEDQKYPDRIKVKYGLPGGKVEPDETPLDAALRESTEEGWEFGQIDKMPFHVDIVEGKIIYWYKALNPKMLFNYKEKGRIENIYVTLDKLKHLGNDFLETNKYIESPNLIFA